MMKFFKGKKRGAIEVSLTELIGALLAVIVILSIVYVVVKLSGIFGSDKEYESTIKNFDLLSQRIENLINEKNYANLNFLYYIDSSYILVGYNYKDPSVEMETCKKSGITNLFTGKEKLVESRKMIGSLCEKSCLCIYKDDSGNDFDKDLKLPVKCKSFDSNVIFLTSSADEGFCSVESGWHPENYPDYYTEEKSYKFLILPGFYTKEVYLDKYKSLDGNIFIYISKFDDSEGKQKRKSFMDSKYGKNEASSKVI